MKGEKKFAALMLAHLISIAPGIFRANDDNNNNNNNNNKNNNNNNETFHSLAYAHHTICVFPTPNTRAVDMRADGGGGCWSKGMKGDAVAGSPLPPAPTPPPPARSPRAP
jgi:hypothetical protein